MAEGEDPQFIPKKNTPNAFMDEISLALRRLEETHKDKAGHTVKKIAKQMWSNQGGGSNYKCDPSFEVQIELELKRMAETGAVVKNKLSKDAWKTADNAFIVNNRGQENAEGFSEPGSHDGGHPLVQEQPSVVGYCELPSTSGKTFNRDLRFLSDTYEDDDMGEGSNEPPAPDTAKATASNTSRIASGDVVDEPVVSPEDLAVQEAGLRGVAAQVLTAFNKQYKVSFVNHTTEFPRCSCKRCSKFDGPPLRRPVFAGDMASSSAVGGSQSQGHRALQAGDVASTSAVGSSQSQGHHASQAGDVASTSAAGCSLTQGHHASQAGDVASSSAAGCSLTQGQGVLESDVTSTSSPRHSVRPLILKRDATPTDAESDCTNNKCPRTDSAEDVCRRGIELADGEDEDPTTEADEYIRRVVDRECEEGGWCSIM